MIQAIRVRIRIQTWLYELAELSTQPWITSISPPASLKSATHIFTMNRKEIYKMLIWIYFYHPFVELESIRRNNEGRNLQTNVKTYASPASDNTMKPSHYRGGGGVKRVNRRSRPQPPEKSQSYLVLSNTHVSGSPEKITKPPSQHSVKGCHQPAIAETHFISGFHRPAIETQFKWVRRYTGGWITGPL